MKNWSRFSFFIVAIVWGASFAFQRPLLFLISPFSYTFWSFFVSGLIFLVIAVNQKAKLFYRLKEGIFLGVLLAGYEILQTVGLHLTTSAETAFITNFGMLLVPYMGWLLYTHRVSLRNNVALLVALVGMYLLVGGMSGLDWGVLVLIGSALLMAFYFLYLERFGGERRSHVVSLLVQQFFVTAGIAALSMWIFNVPFTVPSEAVQALSWQILCFTALPYALIQWAGKWADEMTAAIYDGVVEPLVGGIVAWIFFAEPATRENVIGGIIMVIAFGYASIFSSGKHFLQKGLKAFDAFVR